MRVETFELLAYFENYIFTRNPVILKCDVFFLTYSNTFQTSEVVDVTIQLATQNDG